MKKSICIIGVLLLAGCQTYTPKQYVANMYAKGTLNGYGETGVTCETNKNCPGCHVKSFDRVKLTVTEIMAQNTTTPFVEACEVSVIDSLGLMNITESRYIPATDFTACETVYEKEKSYLKAMGFSE